MFRPVPGGKAIVIWTRRQKITIWRDVAGIHILSSCKKQLGNQPTSPGLEQNLDLKIYIS